MGVVKDGRKDRQRVGTRLGIRRKQAALLDQPHTADVRTLEQSEVHVADVEDALAGDRTIALYVAAILARNDSMSPTVNRQKLSTSSKPAKF